MATLIEIETKAKAYADERNSLADVVANVNEQLEAIKRKWLPVIKRRVAATSEAHSVLKAAIEASPELFVKPRTVQVHGVKVGLQKGKGKVTWDDDDKVVKLIKKHLVESADVLINTKETPNKEAIASLAVADIKRIGCSVSDTGDEVVIKMTDGGVDKIVKALLKDATEEEA